MKQYQIETKNQVTGKWNLYSRFKCRYRLDLSNLVEAEHEALYRAVREANHTHRKRPVCGTPFVAFIETRVMEIVFVPHADVQRSIIWENGDFCEISKNHEAHSV